MAVASRWESLATRSCYAHINCIEAVCDHVGLLPSLVQVSINADLAEDPVMDALVDK